MKLVSKLFAGAMILSTSVAFAQDAAPKKRMMKKKKTVETTEADGSTTTTTTTSGGASYKASYGMAGCGLGSTFFNTNTKGSQITAATTNGTSGNQTFGISTGTSNCKDASGSTTAAEREVYMNANLASLMKEAAQGEGQHLRAFADVLGCADESNLAVFIDVSKSNHSAIFSSEEPTVVLNNYMNVVKGNKQLATSCQRIGA